MKRKIMIVPFIAVVLLLLWIWVFVRADYTTFNIYNMIYLGVLLFVSTAWTLILLGRVKIYLLVGQLFIEMSIFAESMKEMANILNNEAVYLLIERASLVVGFVFISYGIVSERKKVMNMINTDLLTNLNNGRSFRSKVDENIKNNKEFVILILNFDHFRLVNKSQGYDFGDRVIKYIADIIKNYFPPGTFVARASSDEFLIVIEDIDNNEILEAQCKELIDVFTRVHILENKEFHLAVSIGTSLYPKDGDIRPILVRNAYRALKISKRCTLNKYTAFTNEIMDKSNDDMYAKIKIIRAIENNEFKMNYQPIIDLKTNKVIGAEALIRWKDYVKGVEGFTIDKIIRVSEKYGLITELDVYVLNKVCSDINEYNITDSISVNISSITISIKDYANQIISIFEENKINPKKISIEVTETAFIRSEKNVIANLLKLNSKGFIISLDDFGTGYSSLSKLSVLPIDNMKIDIMFVSEIGKSKSEETLLKKMLEFAKIMEFNVVAEGIETIQQYEFLNENSCRFGQGYMYSKALDLNEYVIYRDIFNGKNIIEEKEA